MSRTRLPPKTPPHSSMVAFIDEEPETPAPARAQITNLKKQVQALVRNEHNTNRKHTAEVAELQRRLASLQAESKDAAQLKKTAEVREAEFKRLREEGEKIREELNLHSVVAQQKALLAVASEQLQIIELEQRLVQADAARLMRDHKITLFKAKEADMIADMAEKDARIDELEAELDGANTSIAHQRAAQAKASKLQSSTSQKELEEQQVQLQSLQSKVESLESRLRGSKAREAELKEELEAALSDTRKDGTDKEKRELQKSLRETKASLEKKTEEVEDLQEELANLKEASKQREQALKVKVKEAATERDRLLGVEEELEGLKAGKVRLANAASPDKPQPKSHKVRPRCVSR
ncbi:hypothetical protein DB88DRAFT_477989 [Papiliotrema laurentii]|uniref:Uncharacterized protein n=1 Tax=Papiliotrema laurentii TaxID=5418 RepID=A0AAD9L8Q8_PAPLA|nr:hypothetical protein DB88DRAFT_477989 [Papiliotrema laurentii]